MLGRSGAGGGLALAKSVEGVGGLTYDKSKRSWPPELNVFAALVLIVLAFELIGRFFLNDSFLFNLRPDVPTFFNESSSGSANCIVTIFSRVSG